MVAAQDEPRWTVDELAQAAGLPVRTIREYQTLRVLQPPQRRGRAGFYGQAHLRRLKLIGELRERGYSLAGIRDLLEAWTAGQNLAGLLGEPDAPFVDEAPVTLSRASLAAALPGMEEKQLAELAATGLVEPCGPAESFVPAPSLLHAIADLIAAGGTAHEAMAIARAFSDGSRQIAQAITVQLKRAVSELPDDEALRLLTRGRGLIARGMGRMLIYQLGLALRDAGTSPADARLAELESQLRIGMNSATTADAAETAHGAGGPQPPRTRTGVRR